MSHRDLFDKLAVGRGFPAKSMLGTDFVIFPEAMVGECRWTMLPASWYAQASTAHGRRMIRQEQGWWFLTTREQLAEDIAETLRQMDNLSPVEGGATGSVKDVRVQTLQRLVTSDEWAQAIEAFNHARSTLVTP